VLDKLSALAPRAKESSAKSLPPPPPQAAKTSKADAAKNEVKDR
jgi:hypothetical protein